MHALARLIAISSLPAVAACAPMQPVPMPPPALQLSAELTGAAEVPGPGDPDGSGTATVALDLVRSSVCYTLQVANIAPATAAHIHQGLMGQAGDHLVMLEAPTSGSSSGCATVDPNLIRAMMSNPAAFYVNVHNADYPAGAIRGQLHP